MKPGFSAVGAGAARVMQRTRMGGAVVARLFVRWGSIGFLPVGEETFGVG
ncbi:MAG: hypothetical protein H0U53_08595 [Actinobacteria bacterium]|nr:hypothetical protein [Actinomycetota bacterium]